MGMYPSYCNNRFLIKLKKTKTKKKHRRTYEIAVKYREEETGKSFKAHSWKDGHEQYKSYENKNWL